MLIIYVNYCFIDLASHISNRKFYFKLFHKPMIQLVCISRNLLKRLILVGRNDWNRKRSIQECDWALGCEINCLSNIHCCCQPSEYYFAHEYEWQVVVKQPDFYTWGSKKRKLLKKCVILSIFLKMWVLSAFCLLILSKTTVAQVLAARHQADSFKYIWESTSIYM